MRSNDFCEKIFKKLDSIAVDGTTILSEDEAVDRFINWIEREEKKNISEIEPILRGGGNARIISCAGSGKTTTMIYKIIVDWLSGGIISRDSTLGGVWVCTFLKKGAEDLRLKLQETVERYAKYAKLSGYKFKTFNISANNVSTMHSEFYRLITEIEGVAPKIIEDTENQELLFKVLKSRDFKIKQDSDTLRDIFTALTYTRNRMDDKRYSQEVYADLGLETKDIEEILSDWKALRIVRGLYDFEDLQEKLYTECFENSNQDYLTAITGRYRYLYIDEFQDTSQIQYQIIKLYARDARKVIVIGDDDQIIYTWRGSCGEIITNLFEKDFANAMSYMLTTNYRCPDSILKPAVRSLTHNTFRIEKPISAHKGGGICRVIAGRDYYSMGVALLEQIRKDTENGLSVAVLCRTNEDGLLPALLLAKDDDIDFSIKGEGMSLNRSVGRRLRNIPRLFLDKQSKDVLDILRLLSGIDLADARTLNQICITSAATIWDIPLNEYQASQSKFYKDMGKLVEYRNGHTEMETLYEVYNYCLNTLYFQDESTKNYSLRKDKQAGICLALRCIIQAIEQDFIETYGYCEVSDVDFSLSELSENIESKIGNKKAPVTIATVHDFKGAEIDSVYIWNDVRNVFPHVRGVAKPVLTELEEERRLHYIAMTRARKQCTIMTIDGQQGMFLKETLLTG